MNAPIVYCHRTNYGLAFKCPYCKKNHYHGYGEGHRGAHCYIDSHSPFIETGYILKLKEGTK